MASAQLHNFPAEKRAALDAQMKKMPKSDQQGAVTLQLANLATIGTLLQNSDKKNWIGDAFFPQSFRAPSMIEIKPTGKMPLKCGVVYSGLNQEGVECKWLLAFSALGVDKPAKVYVQAGQFDINWNAIEMQLDEISSHESYYEDPGTGCTAAARISVDQFNNNAYLASTFGDQSN